ncbi:MAG: HAD-IB family hydrolase [Acidimicrobiales bacterium]
MTNSPALTIAAFDLDGTLSEGGSVFKWLRYLRGDRATYMASASLAFPLLVGAIRSGRWADRAKERLFQKLIAGLELTDVRDRSRIFAVEHFEKHGREWLLTRLRWHLQQGHSVVLVSASPQIYVDMVAEMLDTSGGLGTRLAVDARDRLTGSYLGQNCRGKEKMRRLAEWIEEHHPGGEPVVYAYGNSRGDRRMLGAATFPYDVGRLGRLGALRRFPHARDDHFPDKSETPSSLTPDE